MKRLLAVLAAGSVAAVLALLGPVARAANVVAYPSQDTWLDRDNPSTSYGSDYYLRTYAETRSGQNYPTRNILIRFALPSLGNNYTIHGVSLTLRYAGYENMDTNDIVNVGVYQVQPWAAWNNSATWNTINGSTYWHSPYGCEDATYDRYSTLEAWYSFYRSTPGGDKTFNEHLTDLRDTVRSWYAGTTNNGWVLRVYEHVSGQEGVYFYSNNYGSGWGPRLTITYTNLPEANADGGYTCPYLGSVQLNGTGSYDPDGGNITSWLWDLDGDGQFDDASGASPTLTYDYLVNTLRLTPGQSRSIYLKVQDDDGEWSLTAATTSLMILPEPGTLALLAVGALAALRRPRGAGRGRRRAASAE